MDCTLDMLEPSDPDEMTAFVKFIKRHPKVEFTCIGESSDCARSGNYTWRIVGPTAAFAAVLDDLDID